KSLSFKVTGDTREGDTKLTALQAKLKKLSERTTTTKINVDDKLGNIRLREMQMRLEKISRTTARPNVSTASIDRASLAVDKLDYKLDLLAHKHVRPNVSLGSRLAGLFGGGAGGGASLGPWGMLAGAIGALAFAPSLIPLGLGGLAGGAGALAAFKLRPKMFRGVERDFSSTITDALTSTGRGFSGAGPNASFL